MTDLQQAHEAQRRAFLAEGPPSAAERRRRIDVLLAILVDNADELTAAMASDFGTRSRSVSLMNDIVGSIPDIEHTRANLERWMKPKKVNRWSRAAMSADLQPDPLGVVGIISPWNFPLNLAAVPAAAALSAGNRVMIKMSEKAPETATLFERLVADRVDPLEMVVATGDRTVGERFVALPFDHLLFTGSAAVGREVMRRAAANLTPVTLELGGKNPAVVAADGDYSRAAHRIMGARLSNGGQICLCPDYVLVPAGRAADFTNDLLKAAEVLYPSFATNPAYCSLIDQDAYDRVQGLIADAQEHGATVARVGSDGEQIADKATRKIAPTVIGDVTADMKIDAEEVFGPVLTIHEYASVQDAIDFVNARPAPLAAYWYGAASAEFRRVARRTRSGGVSRNDFALHGALSSTPFGGVGNSGMGSYHGKYGFDTFTHYKPIAGTDLPFALTSSTLPLGGAAQRAIDIAMRAYSRVLARRTRY